MQLHRRPHGASVHVRCGCGAAGAAPMLPSIKPTMCLQLILSLQPLGCTWVLDSLPLMHRYFWQLENFSFGVVPPLHGSCQK